MSAAITAEARSRPCPACHETRSSSAGTARQGFEMVRCRGCRTLFTARLPREDEGQDYGEYYHAGNLEVPDFVARKLSEVVAGFEPYRRSNRWLDVGFGAGTLMRAAASGDWSVAGTEVAPGAAEALRAAGFEVYESDLAEAALPSASFDVVSMVEVIEHVPDPDSLFEEARRLLRPGGALYLTTPHGRGVSARLLGASWSAVSPPEHLQLFSVSGLRRALERSGLKPGKTLTHAVNPSELWAAATRRRTEPSQRVETGYRLNESLSGSRRGVLAKRVANGCLNTLRLGDALKAVAERPG